MQAFSGRETLIIEDHTLIISNFINDQRAELEVLHRLQSTLVQDGLDPIQKLQVLSFLEHEALFKIFIHEAEYQTALQDKLVYFDALIRFVDSKSTVA